MDRGWNFDPENYKEAHVDRVVVSPMDKGFVAALPGVVLDGEGYDDEAHEPIMCPRDQFFIEVDDVTYSYHDIEDFVRTVRNGG